MKKIFKKMPIGFRFIALCLVVTFVFAFSNPNNIAAASNSQKLSCEVATGNLLNDANYVNYYKIPLSYFSEYTAGGSNTNLERAFDGNWNTFWQTGKENSATFKNDITVTFNTPVTIDRILYASSSARHGHGYPTTLKIYTALDGELELYDTISSAATNDRVVFKFDAPQTVKKIKFEFDQVNPAHNWTATAKELQFLMPESEAVESLRTNSIFTNYCQTELKEEYKNPDKINEIRSLVENYPAYETSFKPILDRAEAVANGMIKFDARREFATADGSLNKLNQWGNMRTYARDVLKMNSFGINRQVTGIAGMTGEKIVIYVDGNENDPLPKVAFTQTYGHWRIWKQEVQLSLGRNELTFPNLKSNHYTAEIGAGGPIHLINPYTPEQQSGNVKVYIENGSFYPVFRSGDDENTFRLYLEDYYKKLNDPNDDTVKCDVFEVVTDHVMLSTLATHAYDTYITKNISPQSNCDKWDDFMLMLLKFGGVALEPGDEYYDARNQHIYANIRICQPSPGYYAFAADDHIGIIDRGTYGALVNKGATGWAFSHELGHTFDNRDRIWGEVTNNMWAYFDVMHDGLYDRLPLRNVVNQLASDITLTKTSFMSFGDNCVVWMTIEGAFPGYWGKLENLYRFEPTGKSLGRTERMVYYSSLATGTNLFEYFERFGFYMNGDSAYTADNRFTADRASEQLNTLMNEAISSGRISNSGKKIWYIDTKQFSLLIKNNYTLGSWANCYSQSDEIDILEIAKAGQNYSLTLPVPTNADAHLGYEISSFIDGEWKVVGFTYTTTFVDPNVYEQAPIYRVRAFDRCFNATDFTEKTYQEVIREDVCMLNGVYYNSISEAVSNASANDTIYLVKNVEESGIVIDKSLTICPLDSALTDVSILRSGSADIFTVNQGVTLTISGTDDAKIIIDGKNRSSQGSLVRVNGVFNATGNVIFRNNNTTGNGGAIFLNGTINLTNCEICGNSASIGGAIYGNAASTRGNYNNVIFSNNNATNYGGAIYNVGNLTFNNCQFENNTSGVSGGAVCNDRGGIVTLNNCSLTDNKSTNGGAIFADGRTNLNTLNVSGNSATNGGAIYASGGNSARSVHINGGSYSNNTAANSGSLIYHNRGEVYISRSSTAPNLMPSLSGEYYKANSANLTINNQWLDFSDLTFTLQSVNEGSRVFATTFDVNADQVLSVKVKDANVYLDNRIIKVTPKMVTITINFESTTLTQTVPVGYFTFPETVEGLDQGKYIINWTYNGENYNVGDRILIDKDCNFNINVGNYLTVTLIDGDLTESVYVIPNTEYYLPLYSPSGNEVCLWHSENKQIVPATHVTINSDMDFVAETFATFTVTFKNSDGSIISSNNYKYGNTIIVPENPEGQSNEVMNVYFDGWSPNVEKICKGNAEYTATFREEPVDYTVTFKDHDGTVLSTETYGYGDTIKVPDDPTRAATDTTRYTFNGWSPDVEDICAGDAEYVATYTEEEIEQKTYTVIFKDYDGTVLSTETYGYGDTVKVPDDPTRAATDTTRYTFNGWSPDVEDICAGDAEYVATYTEEEIEQKTYTVIFKDYDGTVLSTKTYDYGDTVEVPDDPTRPDTDTTKYTFNGWTPDVEDICAGDAEYVATYTEEEIEQKTYTVIFKDYDGTVLSTKTYDYGDTVEVPDDPTRPDTDTTKYTFNGWTPDVEDICAGDAEYVATYTEEEIEQKTYTVIFKDYDGTVLSTETYGYGDTIKVPDDPTRPDTDTTRYTFNGWSPDVENICAGNAEYVATYTEEKIEQKTITWSDDAEEADQRVEHGKVIIEKAVIGDENALISDDQFGQQGNKGYVGIKSGATVTIKLIPDYGYQVGSLLLNGQTLTPQDEEATYTFTMPDNNLHLRTIFVKSSDEINATAQGVTGGKIEGGAEVISSGNLRLTIADTSMTAEQKEQMKNSTAAKNTDIFSYLEVDLEKFINKGNSGQEWTEELEELTSKIKIILNVGTDLDANKTYVVVRGHNGVYEQIPATYDKTAGMLTFESDKFSDYALATVSDDVPVHTHIYGDWKSDDTNHWKECSCGDKTDVTAHDFKWVVDKEATATETGSKHEECKTCGYKKAAVTIPETTEPSESDPGTGNDDTKSPQTGDNSNMALWFALLFVSCGGVIGMTVYSKRKKQQAE